MSTTILNLTNLNDTIDNKKKPKQYTNKTEHIKLLTDFEIHVDKRIKLLNNFFSSYGEAETLSILFKIVSLYLYGRSNGLKKYVKKIIIESKLPLHLKIHTVEELTTISKNHWDIFLKTLELVNFKVPKQSIHSVLFIDKLKSILHNDETLHNNCTQLFISFLHKCDKMNVKQKYKNTLQLFDIKSLSLKNKEDILQYFLSNYSNLEYKLLSIQYILYHMYYKENKYETILIKIGNDSKLAPNYRADAADILLECSKHAKHIEMAKKIIQNISSSDMIYKDKENVHVKTIQESVKKGILFLHSKSNYKTVTFDKIKFILKKDTKIPRKAIIALERIELDSSLYTNYKLSMKDIMEYLWYYIEQHDSKVELRKRLVEELEEMVFTCTSGYISRIINVISGFGDFNMSISWKQQIINNFNGRITKRIRDLKDMEFRDKIIEEMTGDTRIPQKPNMLKFVKDNYTEVVEEMKKEFIKHIRDDLFYTYCRDAINIYEVGKV